MTVVVIGIALRFLTTSALWLDEALSVNIAKLPLSKIPGALRHDGSPPLYYVLLHLWMRVFGTSDVAARALSGLASVMALPFAYVAGKRLAGRAGAWAVLLLMASSPFAINYAASARMYSFMILWTLLGYLALARAIEEPSAGRLAAVAAVTALILYTHYWGIYLIAVVALWLLARTFGWRDPRAGVGRGDRLRLFGPRRPHGDPTYLRCFGAMVVGGLLFLPWMPWFIFQTLHTGTPWANPAGPGDILSVLNEYSGTGPWGTALGLTLFTLLLLGLFGRSIDGRQVLVELHIHRRIKPIFYTFLATLVLAVACGLVARAAFVGRYTAVVFPLFILVVGLGATVFADRRVMAGVLAWTCLCGVVVGIDLNTSPRTEAPLFASVINQEASPGDLVVYCPDQLGPDTSRLVHAAVNQATFPRGTSPERVDWVDYRKVINATSVETFAFDMLARAAGHDIWFVWRANYAGLEGKCSQLFTLFQDLRSNGQELVSNNSSYYEHAALVRFPE